MGRTLSDRRITRVTTLRQRTSPIGAGGVTGHLAARSIRVGVGEEEAEERSGWGGHDQGRDVVATHRLRHLGGVPFGSDRGRANRHDIGDWPRCGDGTHTLRRLGSLEYE